MGNSLKNFASGIEENKDIIGPIAEKSFAAHFRDNNKDFNRADFYRAVYETVEEINKNLGATQFHIPDAATLEEVYNTHHGDKQKPLTKQEFETILQKVIVKTRFPGIGSKDALLYIFGVPVTTFFIKQQVMPRAIPNEIFIPGITSATVFILAKLNKI